MRNLRKLTAAVLAVALVLTSMATVFAATEDTTSTATATAKVVNGDKAAVLKDLKLYEGKDAKDPKVGLEDALKVQDALIWLATEFGYKAEADKLTDEDADKALKKFADAKDVAGYAKKVVAYSAQEGVIAGEKDKAGKLYIKPTASVKATRFATFMLKGLGYDLKGSFTEAVAQLKEVDGSKISGDETGDLTRDAAVGMMYGILTAKTEAGKTVSEKLLAADSGLQTVLSKNSLLPVNGKLAVDKVKAVANNKVAVILKEEAAATAADFAIVKKGTTTAVAVKDVAKESDKLFIVETDALTGGSSYTLTVNGASINFTGIAADTTAPTVVKVTSPDTNTFEVEYSDKMDFASATDLANYAFDKSLKAVKAELNEDRNKVKVTTDVAKRNIGYNLTIQNVKNSDGKAISKVTRNIIANEDKTAPRISSFQGQNNRMLVIKFEDANGMNKAALETVANYTINDLPVTSATAYDTLGNKDGKFDTVVLMTETQTVGKSYTLTIENLVDNSVLANPLGKATRAFKGFSEDKTAPTVISNSIKSKNNNLVDIEFSDNNAMDAATLEDVSNYTITLGNDNLQVISAKAADTKYPDGYTTKKVTLTTAAQEVNRTYKVSIKGVTDEFGNALKQNGPFNFVAKDVDAKPPFVESVEYKGDTKIRIVFDDEVNETIATDPTNYSIDKDIGAPIKATLEKVNNVKKAVDLTVPKLSNNTNYTVTINNVEDLYGNALSDVKVDVLATSGELDTTVPTISYIYAANKNEIHINFDEKVVSGASCPQTLTVKQTNGTSLQGSAIDFSYVGVIDDGKTLVYKTASNLDSSYSYVIATTSSRFADLAGNKIDQYVDTDPLVPAMADRDIFGGNSIANERPTVYIEQVNVKKVKAIFSEPVLMSNFDVYAVEKGNKDIADTYQTEWNITNNSGKFKSGQEYSFDFSACATDLGGARAEDTDTSKDKTFYTTYMEDSVAPTINSVRAVSRNKVEVLYDEELSAPGTYRIVREYSDNSGNTKTENIATTGVTKDGEKAIITTGDLRVNYNYYLQTISGAIDVAGNRQEKSDEKINFNGSDVETKELGKGVGINNATDVYVTATSAISAVVVDEKFDENTYINIPTTTAIDPTGIKLEDDNKKATVSLKLPVLTSKTYRATIYLVNGGTKVLTFTGNTPDIGLTISRTGSVVDVKASGYTNADYDVVAYATPTASAITVNSKAGTTDTFTFTEAGAPAAEYYIVMKRHNDGVVLYAAKLQF